MSAAVDFDDLYRAITSILPNASFEQDNDGQIVIYAGVDETEEGLTGNIILPKITPTPEGAVRLVVLNDGETFTDANNVSIVDWTGPNEIEDIEEALLFDDPRMTTVAWFDETGVAR